MREALDELAAHDRAVARVYEDLTSPTLSSVVEALPVEHAAQHIFVVDGAGQPVDRLHGPIVGNPDEYERSWRHRDPRMALSIAHPGRVLSDVHHIDPATFERSDVYHAMLRPFDVRFSLFGTATLAGGHTLAHCLFRPPEMEAFDERDVRMMQRLLPHLQRAIDLRIELRDLRSLASDLANALDLAPSPVILLDERGDVLHQNVAAGRVLARGDCLVVRLRRLQTMEPTSAARLQATIARVLTFAEASRGAANVRAPLAVVRAPRPLGPPLSLVVHPLRPRNALRARGHERARALVVVHDPLARATVDAELTASVLGLTATEGELAAALAEGRSLAEFAAVRGCTDATARTHLKRVLEKTGTHRQGELVHRVLSSVAIHHALR